MRTFRCSFGCGVSAEITVTDNFPTDGTSHIQRVEWTGNPRKVKFDNYVAWISGVNSVLAAEWGRRIMHVFTEGADMAKAQCWIYDPGQPPKLIPTPKFTDDVQAACVGVLKHERSSIHTP